MAIFEKNNSNNNADTLELLATLMMEFTAANAGLERLGLSVGSRLVDRRDASNIYTFTHSSDNKLYMNSPYRIQFVCESVRGNRLLIISQAVAGFQQRVELSPAEYETYQIVRRVNCKQDDFDGDWELRDMCILDGYE